MKTIVRKPIEIYLFILFLILFFAMDLFANPQVQGHRGARALRPENTLAAFKYALENKVNILELDLNVTKDNILVVTHDSYINPEICLDPSGRKIRKEVAIRSLTLKEVQTYDCGTLKNKKFPKQVPSRKEQIPTLQQVFDLVANFKGDDAKTVEFNIETKITPNEPELAPTPEAFAKLLFDAIETNKLSNRAVVQSFDNRTLKEIKRLNPKIRTSQLTSDNLVDYVAIAKSTPVDIISPDWQWITKADVDKLHEIGVKVAPWTANDEKAWAKLIEMNVDSIITDDPVSLQKYLKNQD